MWPTILPRVVVFFASAVAAVAGMQEQRVSADAVNKMIMVLPSALRNHSGDPYFPIYHVRPADGWHTNGRRGRCYAAVYCWQALDLVLTRIAFRVQIRMDPFISMGCFICSRNAEEWPQRSQFHQEAGVTTRAAI
jgi:hypothetical protein